MSFQDIWSGHISSEAQSVAEAQINVLSNRKPVYTAADFWDFMWQTVFENQKVILK